MEKFVFTTGNESVMTMVENALQNVHIKEVLFDNKMQVTEYIVTLIDKEIHLPGTQVFYESEEAFRNDKKLDKGYSLYTTKTTILNDEGESILRAWVFKNGEPVLENIPVKGFHYTGYGNWRSHYLFHDDININELYENRDDCLAYNTYKVQDENGNIVERVGIAKQLALTDEQKALVEQYCELTQKMAEAGIAIVRDTEDGCTGFANTNLFSDFKLSYDGFDEYEEISAQYIDWSFNPKVKEQFRWCDCNIWVTRK